MHINWKISLSLPSSKIHIEDNVAEVISISMQSETEFRKTAARVLKLFETDLKISVLRERLI